MSSSDAPVATPDISIGDLAAVRAIKLQAGSAQRSCAARISRLFVCGHAWNIQDNIRSFLGGGARTRTMRESRRAADCDYGNDAAADEINEIVSAQDRR